MHNPRDNREKRKEVEKTGWMSKQTKIDINEEIDLQQEVVKQYTKRSNELSKSTTLSDQYAESIQNLERIKLSKLKGSGRYNQAILKNDNDISN
jgi:CO dehydrogenase/acetyl-CoA synthase delta subunit